MVNFQPEPEYVPSEIALADIVNETNEAITIRNELQKQIESFKKKLVTAENKSIKINTAIEKTQNELAGLTELYTELKKQLDILYEKETEKKYRFVLKNANKIANKLTQLEIKRIKNKREIEFFREKISRLTLSANYVNAKNN